MVMASSSPSSGTSSPVVFSGPPIPATEIEDLLKPELHQPNNVECILVTGGLGFIGSHTALELLNSGYNIIIVDNLTNSYQHVFDRIILAAKLYHAQAGTQCPKAELCLADYRDIPVMSILLSRHSVVTAGQRRSTISGVIHFAAYKEVGESIQHPLKYYQNNVLGLIDFLGLLAEHDIKTFIFSSSASVYGTLSESTTTKTRLREEDCVHEREFYIDPATDSQTYAEQGCTGITSPYGRSKFFSEAILSDLCRSDPSWTVVALRYFNPIGCDSSGLLGEDPKESGSNLFPAAVRVLTGEAPKLYIYGTDWDTPDGSPIRDFIHVSDLARGHHAALSAAQAGRIDGAFRTFNLGTGVGHSVFDVVRALEEASGRYMSVRPVGRKEGDVGCCVAIPERAARELGWRTELSLRDACADVWNYLEGRRK
ncbi:NAD-dependent epimerase/dehydratase family protein [Aspergillus undulatus]|uniref:NAD-dependent epimerase/dehydratase family protein n=1 Tax=Aspergillus undulatus TaxID=1810928 RepID=UPI003CCD2389